MLFRLSTRSEAMLVFSISAVLGALAVNRYAPTAINADTILLSIMSLQNVTPFYWGQNRFANIVPFLLSPVQSPVFNLALHLLIFATAYYAFLIVLTLIVTKRVLGVTNTQDRWLGVAIVIATCTLLISPHAAAVFITEGQPYALSYLAMLAAIWLTRGQHKVRVAASQLAILVSVGLNPSVILFSGPLACLFCFQRRYREGMLLLAGTILSFVFWHVLSKTAPDPGIGYARIQLASIQDDLLRSANSILSAFTVSTLIGSMLVAFAVILISKSPNQNGAWRLLSLLIACMALAWWGLFGVNAWIKANISHFRYFFPTILAICLLLALSLYGQVLQTSPAIKRTTFFACLLILVYALAAQPTRLRDYTIIERTAPYARYASSNQITLVAGDYWVVWPVVFQLLNNRQVAFGITYRGEGNVGALRHWLDSNGHRADLKAMCVASEVRVCEENLRNLTALDWGKSADKCDVAGCVILTNTLDNR